MTPRHASLKQRLLGLILGTITLVWLGATAFTYYDARHEFDEILDAHLAQAATLLVAQASHELDEIETEHAPLLHKYSRHIAFQVWENGKQLRLHSANAPQEHMASIRRGFYDSNFEGQRWRVFSTWDESDEFLIQVAERIDLREELARDIAGNLLRPLLVSLPLLALLLWFAVMRGLHPLEKLTNDVERREPDNLALLDALSAPQEVAPLIERLNQLFVRIDASMQKERRFTADAAHELRTPVAAIKAQAQVAREASNDVERIHALDNAILGCDRAAHLIEQLLTLARVDTLENGATEPCRLNDIAVDIIANLAPTAIQKGIELELLADDEIIVSGNPGLLRVLLRNLLDNSIRYGKPGTLVQTALTCDAGAVCLSVSDNGPGIAESELDKVMERFYRPLGTMADGSGLGLSIVKRIAEVHGASMQLSAGSKGQGLRVEIRFS